MFLNAEQHYERIRPQTKYFEMRIIHPSRRTWNIFGGNCEIVSYLIGIFLT